MKGLFVHQFVIAGVLFFTMLLFILNQMDSDTRSFQSNLYLDRLNLKLLQISEIIMSSTDNGLLDHYPVFDEKKVENFFDSCSKSPEFLSSIFDLQERTYYGVRNHHLRIILRTGYGEFSCGKYVPKYVTKAEIRRFGIYKGKDANLTIVIW